MAFWLGIVVAPLVMLAQLSLSYALVPWACSSQHHHVLDAVAAACLLATLAATAIGWRELRATRPLRGTPLGARRSFLAEVAVAVAGLSALAVLAQWATRLAIAPCVA
jgi:hypothetical protein